MLDFYDALQTLLRSTPVTDINVQVPLLQSYGRILSRDIHVKIAAPVFDNSAMDGYAISGIHQEKWTLKGIIAAGDDDQAEALSHGECMRIFTGAPIPQGTDAVIAQEDVITSKTGSISTDATLRKGQHIRRQGEELQEGHLLIGAHTHLNAAHIALLASQGYTEVSCFKELTTVIFSSGNEITEPGDKLSAGGIYDANRYFLLTALQKLPVRIIDGGILPDSPIQVRDALYTAATQYDIIICSGGASVGDKDYLKDALDELGQLQNWKVSMKPGKPFAWGKCLNSHVFLLPGNPVASFVTYHLLAKPAIKLMSGMCMDHAKPQSIKIPVKHSIDNKGDRRHFMRATLINQDGVSYASIHSMQGSHMLSACANAQLLLDMPAHTTCLENQMATAYLID